PGQQFLLISMGGKAADRVDIRPDLDFLPENPDHFLTVNDPPAKGAFRRKADKDDAGFPAPDIVLEMVADPAAGAHAGTGDDDRSALKSVDRYGFGRLPGEMQSGQG